MGQFSRPLQMRPLHTAAGRLNRLVRAALTHPLGLLLLAAGAAAAGVLQNFPGLEAWSGGAIRLLLWAGAGYLVVAALVLYWQSEPAQLRQLRDIRDRMARRVRQRENTETDSIPSGLTSVCRDALTYLESEIEPKLRELLRRHKALEQELRPYQRGSVRPPSPDFLRRLETIYARQREAIEGSLQQASDMDAALIGLLQEADDTRVVEDARAWAEELRSLHDALEKALHGTGEEAESETVVTVPDEAQAEPLAPDAARGVPLRLVDTGWTEMVEDALRALRNRATLARCRLLDHLPRSIDAALARLGKDPQTTTGLERTQALSGLLNSAVERLRAPEARQGSQEAMVYQIIHEQYVNGTATLSVRMRLGISERTYHRFRHDAVEVIALELKEQEERLSRDGAA